MSEEYVYYTILNKRSIIVRNNVKNSMIKNFLHKLDEEIKEKDDSTDTAYCPISGFNIPHYDKSKINPLEKARENIPCLNRNCEWIEYQTIFYPKMDLWSLPAITFDGLCIICDMERNKTLDITKIVVTKNHKIRIKE